MKNRPDINSYYKRLHPVTIIFEHEFTIVVWTDNFAEHQDILKQIVETYNQNIHNNILNRIIESKMEFKVNPKEIPNWGAKITVQKCEFITYQLNWVYDVETK